MNDVAIQSSSYEGLRELALFAGAGGGILGGKLLGWRTVCAVEREAYPAQVLSQRQNDGSLEPFPIWSDVCSFDGKSWRGRVDVVSGGFPCQDISSAGRGAGISGARSGLWSEMCRIIGEVRPKYAFVENSPLLVSRGLAVVIGDLAEIGYDAVWGIMGASYVGAPHKRERCWVLAYPNCNRRQTERIGERDKRKSTKSLWSESTSRSTQKTMANTNSPQQQGSCCTIGIQQEYSDISCGSWWEVEPAVGRVANGVDHRVDRLKSIGNGQVPQCAAQAFVKLHKHMLNYRDID